MVTERLRVLVSAFATSPFRGSEPGVGWNVCSRMGRYHDVVVLYAERDGKLEYRAEVEEYVRRHGPIPGVEFVPVEHPVAARMLDEVHRHGIWPAYYLGYYLWQRRALEVARRIHLAKPFQLTHQLNMIGFREPGFLWKMDLPFVWGPIGGACGVPWAYRSELRVRALAFHLARNGFNALQKRLARRPRLAAMKAAKIWVVGPDEHAMVRQHWHCNPEYMLETGTDPALIDARPSARRDGIFRLAWSGTLEGRKALGLGLAAVAQASKSVRVELEVVGDGEERETWRRVAQDLGIGGLVQWHGHVSRDRAIEIVRACDALLFTSVKEGTPHVVAEAMALGLPVICHDAQGLRTAVDERCGIKIPMRSPEVSVREFSNAIQRMAGEQGLLSRLSSGAIARAQELSWDLKVEEMAKVYRAIARPTDEVTT